MKNEGSQAGDQGHNGSLGPSLGLKSQEAAEAGEPIVNVRPPALRYLIIINERLQRYIDYLWTSADINPPDPSNDWPPSQTYTAPVM
jgi:hypothetical protein